MKKMMILMILIWCTGLYAGNLVAYFPFTGNADDSSGNGNNGVVDGAVLTSDRFDKENSAYEFDGTNKYIIAKIGIHSAISISLWFKVPYPTKYYPTLLSYGSSPISGGTRCNIGFNGTHPAYIKDGSVGKIGMPNLRSISPPSYNTWHHAVFIHGGNSNNNKMYIDGKLDGSKESYDLQPLNDTLWIGRSHSKNPGNCGGCGYLTGIMDDIHIYDYAINGTIVDSLFRLKLPDTPEIKITSSLAVHATEKQDFSYSIQVEKTSCPSVKYSLLKKASWLYIAGSTVFGTNMNENPKDTIFKIKAECVDLPEIYDTKTVNVKMLAVNDPPVIQNVIGVDVIAKDVFSTRFKVIVNDPDDTPQYLWFLNKKPYTHIENEATWIRSSNLEYIDTLKVIVSDYEFSVDHTWVINVQGETVGVIKPESISETNNTPKYDITGRKLNSLKPIIYFEKGINK